MKAISRWIAYLTVLVVLLAPIGAAAGDKSIVGEVVAISDGDTLTVLTPDKQQVKVRLAEIDAPERRQPYGSRSRQALSELVFREGVRVEVADTDRYGRTVGRIYRQRDNLDVNAELVRQGAAWVYREYNKDPSLLALEAQARQAKRGLWALPEAERTPPWEWRRVQRRTSRPDAAQQPRSTRRRAAASRSAGKWHRVKRQSITSYPAALSGWMVTATGFRARHCAGRG